MNIQKNLIRLAGTFLSLTLLMAAGSSAVQAAEFCSDNYYIDVTLPNQARWDMCWEHRQREGIVLHKIHYTPADGSPRRMVLNEAAIAQIHVPYDDNGARYHDVSDYGLGAAYMSALQADECVDGQLLNFNGKNVVCQQLETRDSAFSYGDDRLQGDALSLFSVSKIGAYNYIPTWRFLDDGAIELGMGATGALQRFGDSSKEQHGWLIGNNKIGLAHLHNFFWKLDFDLAGTANDDYVEELNFTQNNGRLVRSNSRYRNETASKVSPETLRSWRVVDGAVTNGKGQAISYEIRLHQSEHRDEGPAAEPFTHNDFYVTRQKSCELFASHNPTTGSCADNLAAFVNGESVQDQDIVVWPSTTFYHMPRAEDAPRMDAHWSFISITPRDWHDANPLSNSADTSGSDTSGGNGGSGTDTGTDTGGGDTGTDSGNTDGNTDNGADNNGQDGNTDTNPPTPVTTTLYQESFENSNGGWSVNPAGNDTASLGQWELAVPQATTYQGMAIQRNNSPSGSQVLVTGARAGALVGSHDVDGGVTSIRSQLIDLRADARYSLKLAYYFAHLKNTSAADFLRISAVTEQGGRTVLLEETGEARNRPAQWTNLSKDISQLAGTRIRLLIEAADGGSGSIVEAAVDNIRIEKTTGVDTGNTGSSSGDTGTRGDAVQR
ncbi:MAG: hypothetical protein R3E89_10895 [Thiolinea sp.]